MHLPDPHHQLPSAAGDPISKPRRPATAYPAVCPVPRPNDEDASAEELPSAMPSQTLTQSAESSLPSPADLSAVPTPAATTSVQGGIGDQLQSDDWSVRCAALKALQLCSAEERARHMQAIVELLTDEIKRVRESAAEVIAVCSEEERRPHIPALNRWWSSLTVGYRGPQPSSTAFQLQPLHLLLPKGGGIAAQVLNQSD